MASHFILKKIQKTKDQKKKQRRFTIQICDGGIFLFGFFFFFWICFFKKIKYVMGAFWKKKIKMVELQQFESLRGKMSCLKFLK